MSAQHLQTPMDLSSEAAPAGSTARKVQKALPPGKPEDLQTISFITTAEQPGSWRDYEKSPLLTKPALNEQTEGRHRHLGHFSGTG